MNQIRCFDVVLVDFGENTIGSEQGGIRPALVIQNDLGNIYSNTTIVMPFTTNMGKKLTQRTHVLFLENPSIGLIKNSILLGECIRQISEKRVIKKLGHINNAAYREKVKQAYYANFGA